MRMRWSVYPAVTRRCRSTRVEHQDEENKKKWREEEEAKQEEKTAKENVEPVSRTSVQGIVVREG